MVEREVARILVVDDENAIRLTLDMLLHRRGYDVTTAANGEEALAWMMQRRFDILIIDLILPGIDGLDVARGAQMHQPWVRILLLTGQSDLDGSSLEKQIDHFDYILKTASPAAVLDCVTRMMKNDRAMK